MADNADTHENTATVAEPVVKTGGEHTSSFDELELQYETDKEGQRVKRAEARAAKKEAEAKSAESDSKETKKPETVTKADAKDASESKDKAPDKETAKVRNYKVSVNGKSIDLPSDVPIEVKVNGQAEKVTVQELINNYAGKTDWTRKYTDLDREKKSLESNLKKFQTESKQLQASVDQLYDLAVTEKKPMEAIMYLAEAMGGNPVDTWKTLKAQILSAYKDAAPLSDEEIKAIDEREELEYHRRRDQASKAKADEATIKQALETRVNKQLERTGVPMPEFVKAYDELKAAGVKDLNPEVVGDYLAQLKTFNGVKEVVSGLGITDAAKAESVRKQLMEVTQKFPDVTTEMLKEIALEVYATTKKRDGVVSKVTKRDAAATKPRTMEPQREMVSFDEL